MMMTKVAVRIVAEGNWNYTAKGLFCAKPFQFKFPFTGKVSAVMYTTVLHVLFCKALDFSEA